MAEEKQAVAAATPNIVESDAVTVKSLSGFDEGEVLSDGEVVKGTYDENGKLVGWHKEPTTNPAHPTSNGTGEEQPIVRDPNGPADDPAVSQEEQAERAAATEGAK